MIRFKVKSESVSMQVKPVFISMQVKSVSIVNGIHYDGSYEITPTTEQQKLRTKNKSMTDDVTVHAIPFYEVSNTSGGNTVYIANEIQFE